MPLIHMGVSVLFLVTFMFSHFYTDFHKWVIDLVGFPKGDNESTQTHWDVLTLVVVTVGVMLKLLFLKVSRATGKILKNARVRTHDQILFLFHIHLYESSYNFFEDFLTYKFLKTCSSKH